MVIYLIEILKKWVKIVLMTAKWESKKKNKQKLLKWQQHHNQKKKSKRAKLV